MKILLWMSVGFDRRTPSEHILAAIVKALYRQGHSVHIIQKDTGGDLPKLPEGLKELGVTTDTVAVKLPKKNALAARYISDLLYVWRARRYLKENRDCQVVFDQSSNVSGPMAYFAKKIIPGARLVYNVQDIFPENALYSGKIHGLPYRILSHLQKYAYRTADRIVTISEDMREQLVELGVDRDKVRVIYNWSYRDAPYDPREMEDASIRRMFSRDTFNVVYAGNIGVMQNVEILIQAAKLIDDKNIMFHIIGDGAYRDKLLKDAEGMDNIRFWPMQPASLAPYIYSMADVNVIPLAKNIYRTALPSKTATCLACQKPLILAIGQESSFAQRTHEQTGAHVTGSDDAPALVKAVMDIYYGHTVFKSDGYFTSHFQITKNSDDYVRCMTEQ